MEQLWFFFDGCPARNTIFTPQGVILSLLVAFVLGQLLAWVYYATHTGLSYSRSFVQSLILIAVVVSLVMVVIGNSIVTAFGLMGALALVRFRNVIKDTRDVVFVFCSLVIGMAAGSQRFSVAILRCRRWRRLSNRCEPPWSFKNGRWPSFRWNVRTWSCAARWTA